MHRRLRALRDLAIGTLKWCLSYGDVARWKPWKETMTTAGIILLCRGDRSGERTGGPFCDYLVDIRAIAARRTQKFKIGKISSRRFSGPTDALLVSVQAIFPTETSHAGVRLSTDTGPRPSASGFPSSMTRVIPPSDSSNPFAPPGQSAADLWLERSNLDGFVLSGVGYGILATIAFNTLALFVRPKPGRSRERGLIIYVLLTFALATVAFATNAKFNEMQYVDDRGIPGGPNAFGALYYNSFYNMFAFIATDVSRARHVLRAPRRLALPHCFALLGRPERAIRDLLLVALDRAQHDRHMWHYLADLRAGRRIQVAMGEEHAYARRYVGIAAMLIESAALYAIWSLMFLICYARNTPLQNILLSSLGQVQARLQTFIQLILSHNPEQGIAPLLILFRVAQGSAWTQDTGNVNASSGPLTFHQSPNINVSGIGTRSARSFQLGNLSHAAAASSAERGDCESMYCGRPSFTLDDSHEHHDGDKMGSVYGPATIEQAESERTCYNR
ncbi:hypothetical protein MIND_01313800 [Mycena indigotica]|uniref:Uncharacterized protein n=1 Tax=Mycena indigotica TaxID=2126181 RepID=A0A8H6VSW0_9AGAR|nr:uncharacterized protein MIND_01313800 [Mycena indigotica]KAF7290731.1 hypothetical protein MIND_01313800 [Mycena indigotica]